MSKSFSRPPAHYCVMLSICESLGEPQQLELQHNLETNISVLLNTISESTFSYQNKYCSTLSLDQHFSANTSIVHHYLNIFLPAPVLFNNIPKLSSTSTKKMYNQPTYFCKCQCYSTTSADQPIPVCSAPTTG